MPHTLYQKLRGKLRGILEELSVEGISEPASGLGTCAEFAVEMPSVTHLHHPRGHHANCAEQKGRERRGE